MITFSKLGKYGRLGNQLFQISATISLALDNNDKYIFPQWEYQKYFNLHNCFSDNINPTSIYVEPFFNYQKISHTNTKNELLDLIGFWQSELYFRNNQDVIKGLLTPKIGFGIKYNHTAIHVRRGDYTNLKKEYIQLDMLYYKTAMDMIKSKYYIIFSDDIQWCKNNFSGDNIIFSEGKSPAEDLSLGLSCENNIIANSSFSWWMAYLNMNPSKTIIAPKNWFGPALNYNNTKDLLPSNWCQI